MSATYGSFVLDLVPNWFATCDQAISIGFNEHDLARIMSFKNVTCFIDARCYILQLVFLTLCFLKLDFPSLYATTRFVPEVNPPLSLAQCSLNAFCDIQHGQLLVIDAVY